MARVNYNVLLFIMDYYVNVFLFEHNRSTICYAYGGF